VKKDNEYLIKNQKESVTAEQKKIYEDKYRIDFEKLTGDLKKERQKMWSDFHKLIEDTADLKLEKYKEHIEASNKIMKNYSENIKSRDEEIEKMKKTLEENNIKSQTRLQETKSALVKANKDQLDIYDKKMKNLFNEEKIKYMKDQDIIINDLKTINNDMRIDVENLKSESIGLKERIKNIDEKLKHCNDHGRDKDNVIEKLMNEVLELQKSIKELKERNEKNEEKLQKYDDEKIKKSLIIFH